ncbi:hypothetical protein [Schumannella sp. 10F1B-5-1]|uniref:endonuclease toxin domain-containing protein n=1 Tax=Schumannella sp. 10F1B-5-1 TaxID=2590780 RepID=UPI0011328297|nr:hypothetical protein [Schumannella sp. 10F1B-5-1]TPW72322.1 hypothetical protein FJ658_08620 [Schumannella sp. 10F1B-5-1]
MSDAPELVAAPVEMSTPLTGLGVVEDGETVAHAIQNGDWVEGGIGAFSMALDAAALAIDPIGSLISYGLSWVLEHLEPLKGWMNDLTGDAGEVAGFAQTWQNVAAYLQQTGVELQDSLAKASNLAGATMNAYRASRADAATAIAASADWATAIGTGMQIASTIVKAVHDITREALAGIVGSVISAAITTAATFGVGAPAAVAQVTARVSALAAKVGRFVTALVRSIGKLSGLAKQLIEVFERAAAAFAKFIPNRAGGAPVRATPTPVRSFWQSHPFTRGLEIEAELGGNLPRSFPTIDRFDAATETVTSIKSIDLKAKTYAVDGNLERRLTEYIDKVGGFNGARFDGTRIDVDDISHRALEVAIPPGETASQAAVFARMAEYAAGKVPPVTLIKIEMP